MDKSTTRWLDDDIGLIDLEFQRQPRLIAVYVIQTTDGLVLIDTGPGSTLPRLEAGLRELGLNPAEIRHLVLTHIHLDHAGASGSLLESHPEARLYVHEVGAPHMIDPGRLISSASRIYGALMDPLWGDFLPCPEERVVALSGGDTIQIADLRLDVVYTPGHASHHVSFHEPERNVVFTGDVAGVKVPPSRLVWPPTPPPDIDVAAWHESVALLRELDPDQLYIAHFGPVADVNQTLDQLDGRLDEFVQLIAVWQEQGRSRDEMIELLDRHMKQIVFEAGESSDAMHAIALVTPVVMTLNGILRYLRRFEPSAG